MPQNATNERSYEQSHPWLRFRVDLQRAPVELWLLLGEAQSKCEHISGVPLDPITAAKLHALYLAKGALATTAIEGNTLTENQVADLIKGELKLPPSKEYLGREVQNILDACNGIVRTVAANASLPDLCVDTIKDFNRLVLRELDVDEGVSAGQVRTYSVGVGSYRAAPWEDCEYLLERLCAWLNSNTFEPPRASLQIVYSIIKAVLAHLYIAWIHPFGDGNGRTARLVEFQILVSAGVPMPAAHLLSNHYNETRNEYYRQLDRATASGGDPVPFLTYAVQGFVDGLLAQLDTIRMQQIDVAWRNHVHEMFQDQRGDRHIRQRHLVLDLSKREGPVPFVGLTDISARVAAAYAKKTTRTLLRDLSALSAKGLIRFSVNGYVANKAAILAFLPLRLEKSTAAALAKKLGVDSVAPPNKLVV